MLLSTVKVMACCQNGKPRLSKRPAREPKIRVTGTAVQVVIKINKLIIMKARDFFLFMAREDN